MGEKGGRFMSTPVRAMVMAAGAGTRLRPLTQVVAKPMVPLMGKPVLEYTLLNLKKHGIVDIILNLHAFPEQIKSYFGDGSRWGLHLTYSHEPELMGTAGGVKKVEWFLKTGTFIVMSGDGATAIDLARLVRFHRQKKSIATMALSAVETHFDYGVTLINPKGKISRFVEKPSWGDVFSNQVNTGIYVFEPAIFSYIPKNRFYDFGKQVWPTLLKKRELIYAQLAKPFWCDIGNLHEYRRAHMKMLTGKTGIAFQGRAIGPQVWVEDDVIIGPDVHIEGPCWIGKGSRIARGARLVGGNVIGEYAHIGEKSELTQCILWNHVTVGRQSRLEHCILAHRSNVPDQTALYEGILI